MIEVLIATVILSLGLLASAFMQTYSLRTTQDNHFRVQAGQLLEAMVDRILSNPEGMIGGHYAGRTTAAERAPSCLPTACSAEQLADADLAIWRASLVPPAGVLPSLPARLDGSAALGEIARDVDGVYTLSLSWSSLIDGEPTDRSLSTSFHP